MELKLFYSIDQAGQKIIINDQTLYRRDWAEFRSQNVVGLLVFFLSLSLT